MARPRTRSTFVLVRKDELVGGALEAPTNGSGTFTPTSATFCTPTHIFALGLPGMYSNIDL